MSIALRRIKNQTSTKKERHGKTNKNIVLNKFNHVIKRLVTKYWLYWWILCFCFLYTSMILGFRFFLFWRILSFVFIWNVCMCKKGYWNLGGASHVVYTPKCHSNCILLYGFCSVSWVSLSLCCQFTTGVWLLIMCHVFSILLLLSLMLLLLPFLLI